MQPPLLLQVLDETLLRVEQLGRDAPRHRQHLRLEVVVAQHQRGYVVGHLGQQRIALLPGELAVTHGQAEQDLDVHLVIRSVDSSRIVDRVGKDPPARPRVLDAAELRAAEVASPRPAPCSAAPAR